MVRPQMKVAGGAAASGTADAAACGTDRAAAGEAGGAATDVSNRDGVEGRRESMPARAFGVVTADGRCPTCGKVVTDVNAEPLDYEEHEDGTMTVLSVVFVVLPCGHDFRREVRNGG